MSVDSIYLDTCVYRDKFEQRTGISRWGLSQADQAIRVINAIKRGKYDLVASDHLTTQLQRQGFEEDFKKLKKEVEGGAKVIVVEVEGRDKKKARSFCQKFGKVEFEDALHAELAIKGKADLLVTQNIEHFFPYNTTEQKTLEIRMPRNVDWD